MFSHCFAKNRFNQDIIGWVILRAFFLKICIHFLTVSVVINTFVFNHIVLDVWYSYLMALTHWGRVTHKCVSKLTIIGSDNGLSPGRRQAIIWTNGGIMLIGPLGTNFSEILIEIYIFSFKKINLKVSSGKWRPSCLGLNVLRTYAICEIAQHTSLACATRKFELLRGYLTYSGFICIHM